MLDGWNALVERFSLVTDGRGKHIDEEIFETVVALNAVGISTVMSCGGHIDDGRGLLLPWVDIEPSDILLAEMTRLDDEFTLAAEQAHRQIVQLRAEHAAPLLIAEAQRNANRLYQEMHAIQHKIRIQQSKLRIQLADYLARFYDSRYVAFDRRLVLSGHARTRLHNQGALDFYLVAPEALQRQKLLEYREEMQAFTAFLKQAFFAQEMSRD